MVILITWSAAEFASPTDNIFLCLSVESSFPKRKRIKRMEKLSNIVDAKFDHVLCVCDCHGVASLRSRAVKERSVGELAELLNIRDSTVSQHLALLRKDGLVTARRDGQTIWYSISSAPARELVGTLYRVYCAPAPMGVAKARRKTPYPARRRSLAASQ